MRRNSAYDELLNAFQDVSSDDETKDSFDEAMDTSLSKTAHYQRIIDYAYNKGRQGRRETDSVSFCS